MEISKVNPKICIPSSQYSLADQSSRSISCHPKSIPDWHFWGLPVTWHFLATGCASLHALSELLLLALCEADEITLGQKSLPRANVLTFFLVLTSLVIDNICVTYYYSKGNQPTYTEEDMVPLWAVDVVFLIVSPFWLHILDAMRIFSL